MPTALFLMAQLFKIKLFVIVTALQGSNLSRSHGSSVLWAKKKKKKKKKKKTQFKVSLVLNIYNDLCCLSCLIKMLIYFR